MNPQQRRCRMMKFGIIIVVLMLFNMLGHVDAFRPAIHKNGVVSTLGILPVNPSCIPIAATSFGSPTHSRSNYQLCKKENLLLMLDLVDRPCFIPADATKTVAVRSNFLQNTFKKFTGFFRKILGWLYSCFRVSNYIRTRPSLNQSSSAVGTSSSDFIALSSTPINKIPNINAGRIYAQAKLQEIEQYLTRGKVMAVASSSSSSSASGGKRKYTTHESSEKHTLKRSVDDLLDEEVRDKRVLLRCDLNVPIVEGKITDDARLRSSLPTIQHLLGRGAKVVVCSHLGRPKGTGYEAKFSLAPVAARLAVLLGKEVPLVPDCVGVSVQKAVSEMSAGDVVLLENVRFYAEEEANDAHFSSQLARDSGAEVYVNDAFGTAHRAHASAAGVASHVPVAVAGKLVQKELAFLSGAIDTPKRPFAAIVGGNKVSSKMYVLESMLDKVDTLVIGGGMLFTFLQARGVNVGASKVEEAQLALAQRIEAAAKAKNVTLLLASDLVVADRFAADAQHKVVPVAHIPAGWMGMDVGPQTVTDLRAALQGYQTVLWNGPMGVSEFPAFAAGTAAVATLLAELSDAGCVTVVGGGDSVAAVEQAGVAGRMSHISTGGGAALAMLEGKVLPGVASLNDA